MLAGPQVIDPYVTIEVFGIPADASDERTRTVPHNGKQSFLNSTVVMDYLLSLTVFVISVDALISDS